MPNTIPPNWQEKTLGEVCEIERGGSPRPIKSYITTDSNGLNWIKIGDTDPEGKYIYSVKEKIRPEGLAKSRWVEENDFLLSNSMSFGRPYILKTNGCIHDGWLVLRKYQNHLQMDFLYYLLSSPYVQKQFRKSAQGSTVSNLNTQRVAKVRVPIPPLPEQKRIVEKLDKIFADIDKAKETTTQNLKNAQEVFNSVLSDIFNNPPENWEKKTIGEIASIKGGKRVPKGYKLVTHDTGYPYIRVTDFNNEGTVDLSDIHFIEENVYKQISRYTISSKDLYISIAGTIGKSGIIPTKLEGANLTENACKLVLNKGVDQKFLYYFTLTTQFLSQSVEQTKVAGQPKLALSRLAGIKLSIPDIYLQQQIAHKLDLLHDRTQNLEKIYTKTLTVLDELKQSVLQQAFSGKL